MIILDIYAFTEVQLKVRPQLGESKKENKVYFDRKIANR